MPSPSGEMNNNSVGWWVLDVEQRRDNEFFVKVSFILYCRWEKMTKKNGISQRLNYYWCCHYDERIY